MEQLKVYLDTNLILDLFLRHARSLRDGSGLIPTKKFEFFLRERSRFAYVTSIVTRAEVARELVSGYGLTESEVEFLWGHVRQSLQASYVGQLTVDETILPIIYGIRMRLRTLLNFLHVQLAVAEGAVFITGDKGIAKNMKERGLGTALSYPELQQLAGGEGGFGPSSQK